MTNQLNNDLAAYRALLSDEERRTFLGEQKAKIAHMTPNERKAHQQAIRDKVLEIAHRVEETHQLS